MKSLITFVFIALLNQFCQAQSLEQQRGLIEQEEALLSQRKGNANLERRQAAHMSENIFSNLKKTAINDFAAAMFKCIKYKQPEQLVAYFKKIDTVEYLNDYNEKPRKVTIASLPSLEYDAMAMITSSNKKLQEEAKKKNVDFSFIELKQVIVLSEMQEEGVVKGGVQVYLVVGWQNSNDNIFIHLEDCVQSRKGEFFVEEIKFESPIFH